MKKIVLILLAVAFAAVASAQIRWEARLGAAVSKFTETDTKMKMGMKAGVGMEYSFSDLFAVKPGLYYTMKGSSKDDSFAIGNGDAHNLSYLELPVMAWFRFPVSGNFSIGVNAGPYFGLRLNKPDWAKNSGLKTGDIGLGVGVDFQFGDFVLAPEMEYGFTKVGRGDDKNLAYFLCLGYKF